MHLVIILSHCKNPIKLKLVWQKQILHMICEICPETTTCIQKWHVSGDLSLSNRAALQLGMPVCPVGDLGE